MRTWNVAGVALFAVAWSFGGIAVASEKFDFGKREYQANCVLCHGIDLKGGAYVEFLRVTPPDLTQLAKMNGGVFPLERVYDVIDGRREVRFHGTREMPIWGRAYQAEVRDRHIDMSYEGETYIRFRILSLIDYLNRMQAK